MSGARRAVLLVEDEASIADTLIYALGTEGFEVEWKTLGRDGLAALRSRAFDLVILDVGLPDASGFEVCKQIRKESDVPLIFLTARSEEIDRVVGLEIGADDYVSKPFSPREVTARVKRILQRARGPAAATAAFEHDALAGRVRYHGRALELTRYEYLLLATLLATPERIYSRAQLMDLVWTDADVFDRTVDTHVKTLRAKLREVDDAFDPIVTHRGLGYSLRLPG
ncbi:MAG: two-component system response regulator CreB [Deltaproteobacteria bacterium]|nr:two-component system response regulator CreB [Deltaproteobacteria bacterium]